MRLTDVASPEVLLRLIQSVPNPKAEPIKLWLAKVGYERMQDMADPSRSLDQDKKDKKGTDLFSVKTSDNTVPILKHDQSKPVNSHVVRKTSYARSTCDNCNFQHSIRRKHG